MRLVAKHHQHMLVVEHKHWTVGLKDNKIVIDIPIKRHGHDHDSLLTIQIVDIPGEVDESKGYMVWQCRPKVIIEDPRFVEVIGYEDISQEETVLSQGTLSSQRSDKLGV